MDRDPPIVYICSKYSGDIEGNTAMARRYSRHAFELGYAPLAPHLLLPQFISEETEREQAIGIGFAFLAMCSEIWICGSGASEGMRREIERARKLGIPERYVREEELCSQLKKD